MTVSAPLALAAYPPRLVSAPQPGRSARPFMTCVLPCYNEAANLRTLLPELEAFLTAGHDRWEVILVDDGSSDDTAQVLTDWSHRAGFRALLLSRNFGKEAALTAGLEAARGEVVVMMDADHQHPLSFVAQMVQRWQAGADVVYAAREDREDESRFKRQGAAAFYRLINMGSRVHIPDNAGDFRLMDRAVVDALNSLPERTRFLKGMYAWVGFRTEALPYSPAARAHGQSSFKPIKLAALALSGVTAFTTWPLRALTLIGFVLAALAFGYGAFLTVDHLINGTSVSGWTTIVVLLLLFAGVQLLSMGVLGEYLARIFDEVKGRPLYLVRRRLGDDPTESRF
jgi:polyisoprenyl-phosphate glycosyltransferase